jgi:hypothetical protein
MRRKKHQGTLPKSSGFDLLHGTAHRQRDEVEAYPTKRATACSFGAACHAEAAVFTPDGTSLITGSVDGFVEVRGACWRCMLALGVGRADAARSHRELCMLCRMSAADACSGPSMLTPGALHALPRVRGQSRVPSTPLPAHPHTRLPRCTCARMATGALHAGVGR